MKIACRRFDLLFVVFLWPQIAGLLLSLCRWVAITARDRTRICFYRCSFSHLILYNGIRWRYFESLILISSLMWHFISFHFGMHTVAYICVLYGCQISSPFETYKSPILPSPLPPASMHESIYILLVLFRKYACMIIEC